jgi:hypothetical protein
MIIKHLQINCGFKEFQKNPYLSQSFELWERYFLN